ncbi:MAG: lipid asymmetry maintenance protein MlaB [Pseudomonadales bacterium]
MASHELPAIVNFDNLPELRSAGEAYIDGIDAPVFDLARLTVASSAVVALMVAWFRYAHAHGKVVSFVNVPEGVMNIVEVSELTELLPIEASATAHIGGAA